MSAVDGAPAEFDPDSLSGMVSAKSLGGFNWNTEDGYKKHISELEAENKRLRGLVDKAVSFGWDCGHYGKPCDSNEFLRANGLEEG